MIEFNPFPPNVYIFYSVVKILVLKQVGISEKNSYERRGYESVDDKSLS